MNTITTTIDKAGRSVLPKQFREELQLGPGDPIELEASEDHVVLRPARVHLGGLRKVLNRALRRMVLAALRLGCERKYTEHQNRNQRGDGDPPEGKASLHVFLSYLALRSPVNYG